MNMKYLQTLLLLFLFLLPCHGKNFSLSSPNGGLSVDCRNAKSSQTLSVSYNGKQNVISISAFGLNIGDDKGAFHIESMTKPRTVIADYDMISGKRHHCHYAGKESSFLIKNEKGTMINMVLRVFDNGVAFRYELPDGGIINGEQTAYSVPSSTKRWLQNYNLAYEDFFPVVNADVIGKWGYPSLFQSQDSIWMLISEANIERGRCASYLSNENNPKEYNVRLGSEKVTATSGFTTPWRVISIGSLADIVESTLITDLSDDCKLNDTKWIKPGVASWIYWAYNHGSKDYKLVTEYVDMAHELKLPYVLIDWEWENMTNGGNIQDAVKYALSKGVRPILWYNSFTSWTGESAPGKPYLLNDAKTRDEEFDKLEKMGVAGIKIDFFDGDKTSIMDYCIDLLEAAAKHHLLVNFHGATIPRGWQRTYPNLVSTEAVYGAEWYNNKPILTNRAAAHNATLPFTRNVIGPMDYTPCTFTDSQHPHITTDAHELALTVLFESTVQHLADRPEAYLSQPMAVRNFISGLPTVWDETKLLDGYPGEYVVMARRKGTTWYVAGINGTDSVKKLSVPVDFLSKDAYQMTVINDGNSQHQVNIQNLTNADKTQISSVLCQPCGGFVMTIE